MMSVAVASYVVYALPLVTAWPLLLVYDTKVLLATAAPRAVGEVSLQTADGLE